MLSVQCSVLASQSGLWQRRSGEEEGGAGVAERRAQRDRGGAGEAFMCGTGGVRPSVRQSIRPSVRPGGAGRQAACAEASPFAGAGAGRGARARAACMRMWPASPAARTGRSCYASRETRQAHG